MGKVTLKINGNEALSNKSLLKSYGDEALNDNFPLKVMVMKRLMLEKNLYR